MNAGSVKHGTPLHLAAIKERANVVHLLLEKRAVVDHRSEALDLPLHCAAFSGNGSIADALRKKFDEKPKGAEASAKVSMWEVSVKLSIWKMHVASGIAPKNASLGDPTSVYECQPFIVALMMQSKDIVEKCMVWIPCHEQEFYVTRQSSGSGVIRTVSGSTPLIFCAPSGLVSFCEKLLRKGASCTKTDSITARGCSGRRTIVVLWRTTKRGEAGEGIAPEGVTWWPRVGAVKDSHGWNAVTHAAYMGHTACIGVLLHRSGCPRSARRASRRMRGPADSVSSTCGDPKKFEPGVDLWAPGGTSPKPVRDTPPAGRKPPVHHPARYAPRAGPRVRRSGRGGHRAAPDHGAASRQPLVRGLLRRISATCAPRQLGGQRFQVASRAGPLVGADATALFGEDGGLDPRRPGSDLPAG